VGLALCLLALVGLAVFQFIVRNLRLHGLPWVPPPPEWVDGVIRHSVFVLGFLGAAYATFGGRHIRIDTLTRLLRPRARMAVRVLTGLGAVAVCAVVVRAALEFLAICQQEAAEVGNAGQLFTSARGAMVIIAGVALVGFHFLVQVSIDAVYVVSGRPPPDHWIAEAERSEV
ncbi:MAG TPA: TRAP transporter small permease subunit, partial [Polyangia bacterium]|nr:TRAP transporter small permease subunit [Polyangia bacterium]